MYVRTYSHICDNGNYYTCIRVCVCVCVCVCHVLSGSPGFPMSSFLKDRGAFLGRNARMLACQNLYRFKESTEGLAMESVFFRCIFQVTFSTKILFTHHTVNMHARSSHYRKCFIATLKKQSEL